MRRAARLLAQAVLPAAILLGAFVMTNALLKGAASGDKPRVGRSETVYAVTATEIVLGDNRATLRMFGETVAADAVDLRVASPGEVVAVHDTLQVGETVQAGAALVTIDPFAYEGAVREAKAQLSEARAKLAESDAGIDMQESSLTRLEEQLDFAQRDLARAMELTRTGTITEQALDQRKLLVSQRQQALDQNGFELAAEKARRAQQDAVVERLEWLVEKAERALRDTILRAPFTGLVRAENAAVGKLLSETEIAVSLIRADALDARFVLSDQRYGRLLFHEALFGAPVEVTWRIGDIPITYTGMITRAGADIESNRAGVDVYARLDFAGKPQPRPGAFVEVRLPGIVHPASTRVPASALYGGNVFLIDADERLLSVPVNLLALDGGEAIIEGDLADGDVVVTTRLAEAGNGTKVRRVDPFAPSAIPPAGPTPPDLAEALPAEIAPAGTHSGPPSTRTERAPRRRGDGPPQERS